MYDTDAVCLETPKRDQADDRTLLASALNLGKVGMHATTIPAMSSAFLWDDYHLSQAKSGMKGWQARP